ncbi:MAG TPA: signal peptide peptidase SppA [Paludibacteraceae bacterium]|nr:signal peptide peptidase SppA [Paludibacteraceae bacterium]
MLQFLKYTLATLTALVLFSFLGIIIFFVVVAAMVSSAEKKNEIQPNSVLCLNMQGILEERIEEDLYSTLMQDDQLRSLGLDEILKSISVAKTDSCIKGIYIQSDIFVAGFASTREIRNALLDFKKSGKFVIAYADNFLQQSYYLSSVADEIYINPIGSMDFRGLASEATFYTGLFKKLGVEMQVVKVGTYKSYTEQFTNTEMSPANREQMTVLTFSMWNSILSDISLSRNISVDTLNSLASSYLTTQPQERYVEVGLVDGLKYKDEVEGELRKKFSLKEDQDINLLTPSDLKTEDVSLNDDKIAVVYAIGEIDNPQDDGIDSKKLVETLISLKKDSSVKAVVLRINSPGGSGYGSEQIWRAIALLKEKKPIIASMGDYAASGGYYLSCNATKIFAEPTTLTGSIGVFGVIPNLEGLMDKIGVSSDVVKTNLYADMISYKRPMTESERNLLQSYIDRFYRQFVSRCADGRSLPFDSIASVAQGRVWSGISAKQIGLVDELGDLSDAIKEAANQAKINSYDVQYYPEKKSLLEQLMNIPSSSVKSLLSKYSIRNEYEMLEKIRNMDNIQAILPYEIKVK